MHLPQNTKHLAPPPAPPPPPGKKRGWGGGKRCVFWKLRPYFENFPGFTVFFEKYREYGESPYAENFARILKTSRVLQCISEKTLQNTGSFQNTGEVFRIRAFAVLSVLFKKHCKTREVFKIRAKFSEYATFAPPPLQKKIRGEGGGKRFVFWKLRPYFENYPGFTVFFEKVRKVRRKPVFWKLHPYFENFPCFVVFFSLIHCKTREVFKIRAKFSEYGLSLYFPYFSKNTVKPRKFSKYGRSFQNTQRLPPPPLPEFFSGGGGGQTLHILKTSPVFWKLPRFYSVFWKVRKVRRKPEKWSLFCFV